MADELIDTVEMYLKSILELNEEGEVPLRARIAERLDHSGPTVSETIARMHRDGLVDLMPDHRLQFTDEGQHRAVEVMRKHRLAECLLANVIKLDWSHVHEEACRWEHVMSEAVEAKIYALLESPRVSPYGDPIPGLELFGGEPVQHAGGTALVKLPSHPVQGTLIRIGEPLQVDPGVLDQLSSLGIVPGAGVALSPFSGAWRVQADGYADGLEFPVKLAKHLFVSVAPAAA